MLSAVALGLRALQVCHTYLHPQTEKLTHHNQLIFSIVVLGIAATLIKNQVYGSSPTTTRFSTFTGGFGIIVAALGTAGLFITAIPELVVLGVDAICGFLFAAGGIVRPISPPSLNL